jgi:hypothetical protein
VKTAAIAIEIASSRSDHSIGVRYHTTSRVCGHLTLTASSTIIAR